MATSPIRRQHPPLPAQPHQQTLRRMTPEEVMQPSKAQEASKDTRNQINGGSNQTTTITTTKVNAVTLSNGNSITSYTNDDTSEDQPIIFDNEGYDETQLLEGMKHESNQMKLHDVYDEVDASTVGDNVIKEAIPTRWVHRKNGPGARSRVVAKGYTEKIDDEHSVCFYTDVHDTTDTSRATDVTTKLGSATRRRLCSISTCTHHRRPRRQATQATTNHNAGQSHEGLQQDTGVRPGNPELPERAQHGSSATRPSSVLKKQLAQPCMKLHAGLQHQVLPRELRSV